MRFSKTCEKKLTLLKNLIDSLLFDVTKFKRFFNTGKLNVDGGIDDSVLKIKTITNKKNVRDVSTINIPNKITREKIEKSFEIEILINI